MSSKKANNLTLLMEIKDKKEILTGKFTSTLDNKKKEDAWKEATVLAKSLGVLHKEKKWEDLRDKFSVWKSRTLKKRDETRKTGTGGGKEAKLTEFDHRILDIVGKDSPAIDGLPIAETWENFSDGNIENQSEQGHSSLTITNGQQESQLSSTGHLDAIENGSQPVAPSLEQASQVIELGSTQKSVKNTSRKDLEIKQLCHFDSGKISKSKIPNPLYKNHSASFVINRKKLDQMDLKTEMYKLEMYKVRLECAEKEKSLGIPHSDYTKSLFE